ncbi:type IX secretion system protein PorQ [Rapidithrix thailandica]|uniref:Type IX secretion system protein PorQ n=1 Tax=Rapidithrix thailandica TaxID=413964 RepID=A0AAW9S339_9BACT
MKKLNRQTHRPLILFFLIVYAHSMQAQIGGIADFEFLHLPVSAKQSALGGTNVSAAGKEVSMFMANPALLRDSTDRHLALSFYNYYADIQNYNLAYTHHFKKTGTWGFGIQYLNYGEFEGYDAFENATGVFQAKDYALTLSHAHQLSVFSLGLNAKFVHSNIETYNATGLLFDIGGAFIHPDKDLVIGLTFKNLGFAFQSYTPQHSFRMPFDVQAGITYKPERMPMRLSVTIHHLHQFDIAYQDPSQRARLDALGNPIEEEISFADKLARHFIIGGEFVLSKNFQLRAAYNFLRRRELRLEQRSGLAGISLGVMLRVKRLEFAYARETHHLAGGVNNFTLTLNTKGLIKKKKVIE